MKTSHHTVADNGTTTENANLTIDVLANDSDPDTADVLTISSVDVTAGQGSVTNNGTDLEFNPGTDFDYLNAGESV